MGLNAKESAIKEEVVEGCEDSGDFSFLFMI